MSKWWLRASPIIVALFLVAMFVGAKGNTTTVTGKGSVSISLQAQVAMAAELGGTNGLGQPIPLQQEIVPPTFGRGGLSIVSVTYAETGDFLTVVMNGMPTLVVRQSDVASWASLSVVESTINTLIQRQLEVWTPLNNFPKEDPVRNGIFLDNERIETSGRDYLVTTLGYGAIHIFSLSPFKFTTRFNGLDAGPITGEWWR